MTTVLPVIVVFHRTVGFVCGDMANCTVVGAILKDSNVLKDPAIIALDVGWPGRRQVVVSCSHHEH